MADEEPRRKRFKHSIISEHIFQPEFEAIFREHWHGRTAFQNPDIEIIVEPFRVCKISNFLASNKFMMRLKDELINIKSRRNTIDLFQYEQSTDFANINRPSVRMLYDTFRTKLLDWMRLNTRIELNDTISMSSSCYVDTDRLLCHDDNLGDRRIAFILYLNDDWEPKDGGTLDLFDTDENGQPRHVVKSLVPKYNCLLMFEVAHNSYHQVAEVLAPVKARWSINGWFHGPISIAEKVRPESESNYVQHEDTEVDLSEWVLETHLAPNVIRMIQQDVEKNSCVLLPEFLKSDVYDKLWKELQSEDIKWKRVGPADVRNYEVADEEDLPEALANFYRIFKSITFFQLLQSYTHLDLDPKKEGANPRVSIELQRWSNGCYTLITDKNNYEADDTVENVEVEPAEPSTSRCSFQYQRAAPFGGAGSSSSRNDRSRLQANFMEQPMAASSENVIVDDTPPCSDSDDEPAARARPRPPRPPRPQRPPKPQITARDKRLTKRRPRPQEGGPIRPQEPLILPEPVHLNTEDESSDIGDYLSDHDDEDYKAEHGIVDSPEEEEEDEEHDESSEEADDEVSDPESYTSRRRKNEEEEEEEEEESSVLGSLDVIIQFNTHKLQFENIVYVDPEEEDAVLINVPAKDNHLCLVFKTFDVCRLHRYVNHYITGYFYNLICTYIE